MQIKIVAFGIARDIIGQPAIHFDMQGGNTVADLRKALSEQYPRLDALASLSIAVNQEYANNDVLIEASDEVVLIPPVSGG